MGQIDPNTQHRGTGEWSGADASQHEGDGVLVEAQLKQRLRRDPRSVDALCGLAGIHMRRGWLDEALRLVRAAVAHTQDSAQLWGLLTQVLLARGRLREAEESIRKSLRIDPDNAQCWIGLASVNNRLLRPHAALEAYQQAERLDPAIPLLHLSIGHVLKTVGRRADCERVYQECIARARIRRSVLGFPEDCVEYRAVMPRLARRSQLWRSTFDVQKENRRLSSGRVVVIVESRQAAGVVSPDETVR
jgi:tetratricopeptide (TPR) repeat protein